MKLFISVLVLMLSLSLNAKEIPTGNPEREGMSSERLQHVAAMNDRYTEPGKIAGTLTAIVRNGKIVHQSASGKKGALMYYFAVSNDGSECAGNF